MPQPSTIHKTVSSGPSPNANLPTPAPTYANELQNPLRIVHLVSSLKMGGMENFVLRIARAQRDKGHHVSVLALHGGELLDLAKKLNIPVRVLGGMHKIVRVARAAVHLACQRPDILHAHNLTSLHYAVLGKRVSNGRVVLTNHGQGLDKVRAPGSAEWRLTDAVVTVSHAVAKCMDSAQPTSKITTIHNGVTFERAKRSRRSVRADLGISEAEVVGIIVARVDGLKGHSTLLQALSEVRVRRDASVTVLIAGDGAERATMEEFSISLGIGPSHTRFLGFRTDIPDLLAASDFFVLPSLSEGFPLSVLEAMSHGLAIVATNVGGIPELVTSGLHGILVPVENTHALSNAIVAVANDGDYRRTLGNNAKERVWKQFSFAEMTRKYDQLYQHVWGRGA